MNIAIVDDDINMYNRLREYLNDLSEFVFEITYFPSGEAFLSAWKPKMFDLVILDIFMCELNGVDVARTIRKTDSDVRIVFSTTSNEFASESYEVNACYYLRKPFGKDKVKSMLDRIDVKKLEEMRTITLPDGNNILLKNIIYADFDSHRVTLHCKDGTNNIVRVPFSAIESLLCSYDRFFSPTKGVVVNFDEVDMQTDDTFVMSNGKSLPISRRRSKEVKDAYSSYRFDRLRKGDKR